jgi:hypothetical protein
MGDDQAEALGNEIDNVIGRLSDRLILRRQGDMILIFDKGISPDRQNS